MMRQIDETGERNTPLGETAIAVRVFEDLAIVPLLLLLALLAPTGEAMTLGANRRAAATAIGAIALLILIGRYALNPMFGVLARTRTPEVTPAGALLAVGEPLSPGDQPAGARGDRQGLR